MQTWKTVLIFRNKSEETTFSLFSPSDCVLAAAAKETSRASASNATELDDIFTWKSHTNLLPQTHSLVDNLVKPFSIGNNIVKRQCT